MQAFTTGHRVAFVTGAARGIGLAIAQWFHARDWRVALIDIDRETLLRTHAAWGDAERVLAVPCDVSQPGQVDAAVQAIVDRFGRIDALVNNAGVAVFKPLLQTTHD
ncbi:MAG TPA: SDR family NAD(P)-dependent oxidoreductase, partial [Burkholderiaceae bacterium]|nr:SDR family NAD(P)-dependent oxidoreductase [Burkholderiaceae bacterium]